MVGTRIDCAHTLSSKERLWVSMSSSALTSSSSSIGRSWATVGWLYFSGEGCGWVDGDAADDDDEDEDADSLLMNGYLGLPWLWLWVLLLE